MIGEKFGSYEVVEEIGKGGMAKVYRAYHPSMDRDVAIKVISKSIADSEDAVVRFQREARLIARLEHIHILPVYDFDGAHDPPYIVMRYLEGGTLKDIMKRGALPIGEVGYIMQQLCGAVGYAHRQGIVHRDIKPSNIMVDREGNLFVTDFGIAKITSRTGKEDGQPVTQTGATIGTPEYMSPEQGMGSLDVDHRADIYALGVLFFELLTGERPFKSTSPMEMVIKHLQEPVPSASEIRTDLPEAVDLVIMRVMSKDPDDRYQTVDEFMDAIQRAFGDSPAASPTQVQGMLTEVQPAPYAADTPSTGTSTTSTSTSTSTTTEQNKLVTVLYADASEYAEIVEDEEGVEAARQAINKFWDASNQIVAASNGFIVERGERDLLALWGVESTREDDTERAIKAGLAIQDKLQELAADLLLDEEDEPLPLNIGIHTGLALLTPGETGITATGSTISLTNRLAKNAMGIILITKEALRNVQGIFDIEEDAPLRLRGRKDKLPTYRVIMVKPRAFKIETRGIHGVETDMVGRETEFKHLQNAFEDAIEEEETQVVTILSDAGLGKSRLLHEFELWTELNPEDFRVFEGRATSNMTNRPYALIRDIISFRFEVLDSDAPDVVREKLETGVDELTGKANVEMAHMVGHLVGFDFSDSDHIKGLLEDPKQLTDRGKQLFKRLIIQTCEDMPVVMQLEDMHHADEASLSLLNELVDENDELPLIMITLARPELMERFPVWGTGQSYHEVMTLNPLTNREGRQLVKEILKNVDSVPKDLRNLLVDHAEGNPYFMEEVIKMLIEDRVIQIEDEKTWVIDESKVANLRVPPTLVGLLQTRIDTLLLPERVLLQRAAVIGRIFFDGALKALDAVDEIKLDNIDELLETLIERDFIYERGTSAFEGQKEYIFAKSMMRDAIYEGLLRRQKRTYHTAAADWIIDIAGERADEYIQVIADHYLQGEENEKAAEYLYKAGEKAFSISALKESRAAAEQVLDLLHDDGSNDELLMKAELRLSSISISMGDYENAKKHSNSSLSRAHKLDNVKMMVEAYNLISQLAQSQGDSETLKDLQEKLKTVEVDEGDFLTKGVKLAALMTNYISLGEIDEADSIGREMVELVEYIDEPRQKAGVYNSLGNLAFTKGDMKASRYYLERSGEIAERAGNRRGQAIISGNIGEILRMEERDYDGAIKYYQKAYDIAVEIGDVEQQAICLLNLGLAAFGLGNIDDIIHHSKIGLELSIGFNATFFILLMTQNFASVKIIEDDIDTALAWLGMSFVHPAADYSLKEDARVFLNAIKEKGYSDEQIEAGLKKGENLQLDDILEIISKEYDVELKG